ncbi:MAG: M28 family peptidase [Actinomycetota bacterium]|nr:M28 family peptidase [Actinomycetota bacterium]
MHPTETASRLAAFDRRGAGSDAELRTARWLAAELQDAGREVAIEPFWCRPNWALANAWHVALGLAGSLLSVHSPRVGGAMILVALLSLISDGLFGSSLGRLLTPERASQNVIGLPPRETRDKRVRLVLTANYDAGRLGLAYRDRSRAVLAPARRLTGGLGPGWIGWLAIFLVWMLVTALLRLGGQHGSAIGVAQLVPTVALVLALAILLELASSEFGPAAADNGSGVAAVIYIARALDAAPPLEAAVEVVLTGAGDGSGIGLRRYLRRRRGVLRADNSVVVGIGACAAGQPRWWQSDGALVPVRHFAELRDLCRRMAEEDPGLELAPARGRGSSPALPARLAGVPSIAVGCLDRRGLVPNSHQATDTGDSPQSAAPDGIVEIGLLLTDAIDGYLARMEPAPPRQHTSARRLLGRA